jgi:AcrR family transcriptional regulator
VIALSEEEADRSVARLATSGSSGSAMRSDSREEMENQLIAAAANLFQRKGFVGATTRELAKSMGLQTSSLYHYLESKQDLLYVVCVRATNAISTQVAEAVKAAPPADRLRSAIQAHVAATLSEQDMHAVMLREFRHLDQDRRDEVSRLHHSYHQQIRDLLGEEQDAGRLRKDVDTKYLALMLTNLLNWTIYWFDPAGPLQAPELASLLYDQFMNGARSEFPDYSGD